MSETDRLSAGIVWIAVGLFAQAMFLSMWHSKARYAVQYGVKYDEVYKGKTPHDCDFLAAPIGRKGCHYDVDATVSNVLTRKDPNTGRPIVSYDDGKTWAWNDIAGTTPSVASKGVSVNFTKVDDD